LIDPLNPTTLYAATSAGIFKTTNCESGDPTWTNILSAYTYDIEMKPDNIVVLYSSSYINGYWKVMISQNNGNDWLPLPNQPEIYTNSDTDRQFFTIEVSKAKPGYIYCVARNISLYSYYYSNLDIGSNWILLGSQNDVNCGFGGGHSFGVEQVFNGEDIIVSFNVKLRKYNINTGYVGSYNVVHADVEDVVFHPYNVNEVWACTHGGVEKSTDGGILWEPRYNGLGVAMVQKMATSYTDPKYILLGLDHDGVQLTDAVYEPNWNPIWNWINNFYIDGMQPLIDNNDPNNMWGSGQHGMWRYSSNAFNTSQPVDYVSTYWITTGVLNKLNPSVLFRNFNSTTSDEEVFRSTDKGLSTGNNEFISSFQTQLQTSNRINILGLFTPYNNGDYLIALLYDITTNGYQTWHVFRSINANAPQAQVAWEELPIPRSDTEMTSIEFDPDNPDIIFMAYTNSSNESRFPYANEMIYKIDYTNTSNPVFTDISYNNFPYTVARENSIAVEKGSNGGVYVATEFGVYYTNNEMLNVTGNEWKLVGTELPHVPSHGLEINYISNSLRVGTRGRGVWEIPLPCIYSEQPLVIDNNKTWDSFMRLDRSIIISPGTILTIDENARIAMPTESKIIIQPGGKLILDGGTLTNACGNQWQGIEVWGDPLLSQTPSNQGTIEIINGGTIENAVVAVRLGSKDYTNKGGGIIFATEAVFRNNNTGVKFETYSSGNSSYFDRCTFETTAGLPDNQTPQYFVMMTSVDGIDIKGCTFENSLSDEVLYADRGIGIYSVNSVFTVDKVCISGTTPCTLYQYPEFNNLNYAIKALATSSNTPCYIREGQFTDNRRGVYLSGISSATFTNNIIHMSLEQFGSVTNDTIYGSYFDACTGYTFHENQFISDYDQYNSKIALGLVINNSGPDNNLVYDNIFENVFTSTLIQGENRNNGGSTCLVIKCNQFYNTLYDEVITFPGLFSTAYMGIALHQGANTLNNPDMAGNLFYYNAISKDYDDLNNKANLFHYYYPRNTSISNLEPLDITSNKVTKVGILNSPYWTIENGCPAATNPGGGESESLLMQINEAGQQIDSTLNILAMLIDSGDTESLQDVVETSTSSSSMQVYNELMSTSPYLSDTVVSTAIGKEDVLPNAMLRDVMVANPNAAKSDELLSKLDSRWDPMPDYMKAQILQGRCIVSLREETEANLSAYRLKKSIAFNQLVNYYLAQPDLDSLALLFSSDNTISSKYRLAFLYLSKGEFEAGTTILNAIPSQFELTSEDLTSQEAIVDYYDLLAANPHGMITPDSTQLAQISNISSSGTGNASVYARNLLLAMDQITYNEPILLPDLYKSAEAVETYEKLLNTGQPPSLKVYPNPSKDYVIVEFVTDITKNSFLVINDSNGQRIKSMQLNSCRDQLVIDTRGWKPGIYIATLKTDAKTIESCKFSIVK